MLIEQDSIHIQTVEEKQNPLPCTIRGEGGSKTSSFTFCHRFQYAVFFSPQTPASYEQSYVKLIINPKSTAQTCIWLVM